MNEILVFGCGILFAMVINQVLKEWRLGISAQRRADAERTLKEHGLTAQFYLPTIVENDPNLRAALDTFTFSGYIITDVEGKIVGRLCAKAAKAPQKTRKAPYLQFVVSND